MVVASSATRRRGGDNHKIVYYTYVLISLKNKRFYIGTTDDLKQRVVEHNNGVGGTYTKRNRPFRLIFYEAFLSKRDALRQEKFYKSGYGREVLREKIKNSLEHCGVV